MDVRKKLVELLKTDICPSPLVCDPACHYSGCDNCFPERFADHLIANGVTVQEPQKPIEHKLTGCGVKIGNAFWGRGTTVYKCPKCGDFVSRIYDFFYKCGQAFDWSELHKDKDCEHGGKDTDVPAKWIPVTERLPVENGNYIVTVCDEGCSCGEGIWYDTVVVVAEYYNGNWTWNENGTEHDLCGIVTHWMPLPEPPEEG